MQDQRLINRLQNYWEIIRRGKTLPEIGQLNPGNIIDMWPQCLKMGVTNTQNGTVYQYVHVGEKIISMYGRDLTGETASKNTTGYPLSIVIKKLDSTYEAKNFCVDENQFVNERGNVVKYRACFMPFGNDTRGVTHIVIGFSGREFDQ